MARYVVYKCVGSRHGAFCFTGPKFGTLWMARLYVWAHEAFNGLHDYRLFEIHEQRSSSEEKANGGG